MFSYISMNIIKDILKNEQKKSNIFRYRYFKYNNKKIDIIENKTLWLKVKKKNIFYLRNKRNIIIRFWINFQ